MLEQLRDKLAQFHYLSQQEGLTDTQYREAAMLLREYNRLLTAERRWKASILRGLDRVVDTDSGINDRLYAVKHTY